MVERAKGGDGIKVASVVGGFIGLAVCAIAVGGFAGALTVPNDGPAPHNLIEAGHLLLEVNGGQGSDIEFSNLVPGDVRTGDQLVTADMGGVHAASLVLALSSAQQSLFNDHASMTVSYGEPEPATSIDWTNRTCTPGSGYTSDEDYQPLSMLSSGQTINLGTLTTSDNAICVRFAVAFDASAGNPMQGSSSGFSMDYALTQQASSP